MPSGPRTTSSARRLAAFTLVEMLTVVTIVGIGAAVVVPMVADTASLRAAAAQRKVAADLQYAQGLAVARRQSIYVRCVADQYDLCTLVNNALVPVAHPVNPGTFVVRFGATAKESALAHVTFARPSFASAADHTLGFDATGVPFSFNDSTGTKSSLATRSEFRVTASNATRYVYVEAFTGELRVP
jgi:prepilin-type N-terminal cleavage/methylation domain-containing protein